MSICTIRILSLPCPANRLLVRVALCTVIVLPISWMLNTMSSSAGTPRFDCPLIWPAEVPPHWPDEPKLCVRGTTWIRTVDTAGDYGSSMYSAQRVSVGIPFRAADAVSIHERTSDGTAVSYGSVWLRGVEIPLSRNGLVPYQCVLPVRPIWSGLIGNALCYSIVVEMLRAILRAWRHRSRVRKHHCVVCGYPVDRFRQAVCPECGMSPVVDAENPIASPKPAITPPSDSDDEGHRPSPPK